MTQRSCSFRQRFETKKPVEIVWQELLRAIVQDRTESTGVPEPSEPGFGINKRAFFQMSKPGRQNQQSCLLSEGPLYFVCLI
ncbi:hypothetical protein N9C39_08360 [Luminiphilus sp.]|nr:hypothetical protein [Luminiphilus sp.]